jgi:hypothetical protein
MTEKRNFTIDAAAHRDGCGTKYQIKGYTGRFHSANPGSAARKAATSLCRRKKIRGRCVLYISMREITQGSKSRGKVFTYRLTRKKRDTVGPHGQIYEIVGKSTGIIPDTCPKSRKSSGRMVGHHSKILSKRRSRQESRMSKSAKTSHISKSAKTTRKTIKRSKSLIQTVFGL